MSSHNPITGQPCPCLGHRPGPQSPELVGPGEVVGWNSQAKRWEMCPSNPPRNNGFKQLRYGWTIEGPAAPQGGKPGPDGADILASWVSTDESAVAVAVKGRRK